MCKSDGAMPFSLGCQKVMDYPESAKTQIQEPAQKNIDELRIFVDVGKVGKYVSRTGLGEQEKKCEIGTFKYGLLRICKNLDLGLH